MTTRNDWYVALAHAVRDRLLERWSRSVQAFLAPEAKVICYLSAEFLIGPQLGNNLLNLGIERETREAPASSIRSPRSSGPRSATGSATSSASSTSRSATAGRSR
jgi:glucan phosphorylase